MAAVSLRLGDLVWGKLGRYPPWPGKIVNPPKDLKKPRGKKCFFVKFFGTEDHAWIKVEQLKPYHPHKEEMIKINKGKRFQQAVDAVEEFLRKTKGRDQASSHNSNEEKNRHNSSEERGKQSAGEEKRKASFPEGKLKKGTGEGKKRVSSVSSERGSKSPLKRAQDQSPRKRGRPPKDEKDLTIPESSTVKRVMTGTVAGFKWPPSVSEPVKDSDPHFHHFLLSQTEKPAVCYQAITKKLKVCEEETGSTSIQAADSTAVNGSITPTDKKIGFLGLGLMGSGIVSNLLKMGHTVTVWNRTAEKEEEFKWLLQEEVHVVLKQLQDILKEASQCFALPASGLGGAVKQENFVLSTSSTDQVKGVLTLQGDALCQADISLKMPRNNQLLHFAFREDKQWKLQQKMFTPALPPDILVNFYINLNKLCLTVYQLHVLQPGTTKNVKLAGGSILHNPGAIFEFGNQRYEVSHVHKVECVVPWLNDALVFFTVSLQLCQQLKDKAVAADRTKGCQDCMAKKIVLAQSCRESCVWRHRHEA
ncbi:cytokine-like nuclear factor N-PAC isoform X7 [Pezoporus flaviventris]|uniref:cytokine-like nuclear factor N-PAC isoform X7 n=1 Tax=Pezoporus flaviventris TaxID=889875 RepID=UPI002AB29DA7|nr:cytokine-like nuclear factor N-PAC isoform X7 [Pezoporus flaviventris]